ncbi:MAG TPA: GAF domain-containing protein, partial [Pseudomonas sp.]|nr:GAF domain-containing protein [Pseudomonas sp.]
MPSSIRLRPLIICTFVLLVVGIGASISLLVYERSAKLLHREAMLSAKNATQATSRELLYNLRPTQRAVRILAHLSEVGSGDLQQWLTILPVMVEALQVSPTAHAFYFANQQGNMFMVRRLVAGVDKAAPPATRFVVLAIERIGSQAQAVRLYFDGQLRELSRHVDEHARGFDPRQRPWFTLAMSSPSLVRTDPYAFYTSGEVGTTLALATPNGQGVVAADVSHYLLAQMLRSYRSTPSSRLLLFDQAGRVLAAGDRQILDQSVGMQPLGQSLNPILKAMAHAPLQSGGEQVRDAEQRTWFVQRLQVSMTKVPLFLGIAVPEDELLDDARQLRNSVLRDSVLILLLALPLVVWLSGRLARPISELTQRAESLRHFDFSEPQQAPQTGSKITEVRQLGQTLDSSRSSLQRFIEIIARLSGESDTERLLPTLLQSTCEACAAHGALLYIRQDQHSPLYLAAGRWGTRELALVDAPVLFAVEQALAEQRSVFEAADSVACGLLDLPATASLSVPLFSRQHSGVGVLVLFHQQPPASSQVRFIEALSGFAAMALETLGLIDKQKALFEAFIQLIASAIDAKSPYTGGHCSRVPEATKLLAEAVCAETQGPYADFRMDQADWQALHIGAWLHDCG